MQFFDRRDKDETRALVAAMQNGLITKLAELGAGAPIVIGKIEININYASGGGATVNVRTKP